MSDEWVPAHLRGQRRFTSGLTAIQEAAVKALRDFGALALGKVVTGPGVMPDSAGIMLAAPFWAKQVDAKIITEVAALLGDRYAQQLAARGLDPSTIVIDKVPAVENHLASVRNRLVRVPDEVFDDIRVKISNSLRAGRTIPQIAAEVTDSLSGKAEIWASRGTNVARSEAIAAWNGGSLAAARTVNAVLGEPLLKRWRSTVTDHRTRPSHVAAEGQTVPLGGVFSVGAAHLDFPGDPAGPAAETINCRCAILEGTAAELDALAASAGGEQKEGDTMPRTRAATRARGALLAAAPLSDADLSYATDTLDAIRQCLAYTQGYLDNLPDGADTDLVKWAKAEVAQDAKDITEVSKWFTDSGAEVPADPSAPADGSAPAPAPAPDAAPAPATTDIDMVISAFTGLTEEADAALDQLSTGTYQPALDYAAAELAGVPVEFATLRTIAVAVGATLPVETDTGTIGQDGAPVPGAPPAPAMAAGSLAFTITGDTDLPIGDYGTTWDGSAAAQRMLDAASSKAADGTETIDVAKASKGFIVRDDDGSLRGDYRLGFADIVGGTLTMIPSGVQACAGEHGIAAIQGLSADDKAAAQTRICSLYDKIKAKYPDQAPDCPLTASGALLADGTTDPSALPSGWRGVLAPLDVKSSDYRMIATPAGELRCRQPPMTLLFMPSLGDYGHDGATVAGRIDRVYAENGMIMGEGMFDLGGDAGTEAARQLALGLANGISLDLGDVTTEWRLFLTADDSPVDMSSMDENAIWDMLDSGEVYEIGVATDYEVVAATLAVGQPAFDLARIQPVYGYASPADAVPYEVPPALAASAGAQLAAAPPPSAFQAPAFSGPTPIAITADGRVSGHAALWDTCHLGIGRSCVVAPHSLTGYSYFHTGAVVLDDGTTLPVGRITLGGGHASATAGMAATMEHYDDAGSVVAVVRACEDEYGIVLAGQLADDVTPEQIEALRRSPISGDWRMVGGNLELVAALAVNVPGFPVVRADGERQLSLTASLSPRHPAARSGRRGTGADWPLIDVKAIAAAVISETRLAAARERQAARLAHRIGRDPASRALRAAASIGKIGD